jgi:hypothetical protein
VTINKTTTDFPWSVFKKEEQSWRRRSFKLKSEKGIGEHKFEGKENDERHSGTICSANNGIGNQTNYRVTTNENSIGDTTKGAETGGTIDDISIGKTTEGTKLGN